MNKNRRRIFTIVPEKSKMRIQFRYVLLVIVTQVICIAILVVGFNAILHILLKAAQLGPYAESQLGKVFFWMNFLFGTVTLLAVLIGGIMSLHISHKFVGPIFRIENLLKEAMSREKVTEFTVRKEDELHELVTLLNQFLTKKGLL